MDENHAALENSWTKDSSSVFNAKVWFIGFMSDKAITQLLRLQSLLPRRWNFLAKSNNSELTCPAIAWESVGSSFRRRGAPPSVLPIYDLKVILHWRNLNIFFKTPLLFSFLLFIFLFSWASPPSKRYNRLFYLQIKSVESLENQERCN